MTKDLTPGTNLKRKNKSGPPPCRKHHEVPLLPFGPSGIIHRRPAEDEPIKDVPDAEILSRSQCGAPDAPSLLNVSVTRELFGG